MSLLAALMELRHRQNSCRYVFLTTFSGSVANEQRQAVKREGLLRGEEDRVVPTLFTIATDKNLRAFEFLNFHSTRKNSSLHTRER